MKEIVSFGSWEGRPLEWMVISEDGDSRTLFCNSSVGFMSYSESGSAFYDESDVRRFLEGEFYQTAFTEEERARILPTELDLSEYQTYYGAVGVGATAHKRDSITATVFLLSVREIMRTYKLTNEDIYRQGPSLFWTRSPDSLRSVSLVYCSNEILRGESPYTYETRSYDHTTGMVDSSTFPYAAFASNKSNVIPAVRVRK